MLAIFGVPADGFEGERLMAKALALAFTLGVAAAGATLLIRSAQPGRRGSKPLLVVGMLLVALVAAACATLAASSPAAWGDMIFGPQWAACLICIPLFALAPFASLIWALRKGAPTNLAWAGAAAGLVAGALGATAFAVHHAGGSIPFIAVWYGGAIVLCAAVGAILGPRLLRW
jgi:hypothetical protein